jgi:manganese transport protein
MGNFVNPRWLKFAAWAISAIIITLNLKLLLDFFF